MFNFVTPTLTRKKTLFVFVRGSHIKSCGVSGFSEGGNFNQPVRLFLGKMYSYNVVVNGFFCVYGHYKKVSVFCCRNCWSALLKLKAKRLKKRFSYLCNISLTRHKNSIFVLIGKEFTLHSIQG